MSSCDRFQEAIGAIADGEDPGMDPVVVEQHVAGCAHCRAHREFVHSLRRGSMHQVPLSGEDLSSTVVASSRRLDGMWTWTFPRGVLAICAIVIIASAVIDLVGSTGDLDLHAQRHLGAFALAYGIALAVVVVRPARARTVLPISFVVVLALLVTTAVDVIDGEIPLSREFAHLPELISVLAVWALSRAGLRGETGASSGVRPL